MTPGSPEDENQNATRRVFWEEDDLLRRLRRIEGQVRGIQAMVTRQESCRAILTQLMAVKGALDQVSRIVSACSVAEGLDEVAGLPDVEAIKARLRDLIQH
jgi:DNA-binding FrmR family transcriptional regulator